MTDDRRPDASPDQRVAPPTPDAPPPLRTRTGWLRAGGMAPVQRRRRPLVRLALALTSGTALLATAAIVGAAAIVPPIGARRAARLSAEREVQTQLGPGEKVVASVFASQRRWTDMWRESHGIVVATDRRLLYVGAPPTPLLRPREDGPEELLVESYRYDAAFTLEPRTLFRGMVRGLDLRTPVVHVRFIVDDAAWPDAQQVSGATADARRAVTRRDEAFAASTRAAPVVAAQYVFHVIQRGETLSGLARRFRTSPDVLRQLNQLTSDNIRIGQRLRVPLVPDSL